MTTIAPKKVELKCIKTGIVKIWTNQANIQKNIDKFGSLEAFQAQYVSKGASSSSKTTSIVTTTKKPVDTSKGHYQERVFQFNDTFGKPMTPCTVGTWVPGV